MNSRDLDTLSALFSSHFGEEPASIVALRGDGSAREIYRIRGAERTCIGIAGENDDENRAFIGFSRTFRMAGLRVPEIYAVSENEQAYLEEDLGGETVYDWMLANRDDPEYHINLEALYRRILTELPRFQIDAGRDIDYGLCYQTQEFGREQMDFDVRYFAEMFLDLVWKQDYDRDIFFMDTSRLIDELLMERRDFFLYRDFQSRNIMLKGGDLYFIDYQSGRRGALQYDAASLLYDAKTRIPQDMRARLLDFYIVEAEKRIPVNGQEFIRRYYGYAVIRVMQAMGAYGNLGVRQKKPGFASSIPPAQKSLADLVLNAEILQGLPALRSIFAAVSADTSLAIYGNEL